MPIHQEGWFLMNVHIAIIYLPPASETYAANKLFVTIIDTSDLMTAVVGR